MDSLPRSFGKYSLERRLGVGGMAETFVARRDGPGGIAQHVCLKRVLPAFNGDKSFRDQFQREARLAARLRHSNIVGTIDYGSVGEVQYMALELVEGLDLRALLSAQPNNRLPLEQAVLIAFDVAHALEYAHAPRESDEGIVHRDVTPSNILLSIDGAVKLADFGVAKALGTATAMTATGVMKGKMPYMPPEQMKGGAIDGRVDLFSVGVMLYESLAGRRPFTGAHDVEVMTKIISGDRPNLRELAPDVPVALEAVVHALIATEVEERTSDASTLIDQLAPFVPPPSARERLAALVSAAYGSERHGGAASDTQLQEAGELQPSSAPRSDPFAHTELASSPLEASDNLSGTRPARPTIRQIAGDERRPSAPPITSEQATRFGYGAQEALAAAEASAEARGQEADTLEESGIAIPTLSAQMRVDTGRTGPTQRTARADDEPSTDEVATLERSSPEKARSNRPLMIGAVAALLVIGGVTAFALTGDDEPVDPTPPTTVATEPVNAGMPSTETPSTETPSSETPGD